MRALVAKWAVPVLVATAITAALFAAACAKVSAATGWMMGGVQCP